MKTGRNAYRIAILAAFGLLVLALTLMVTNLVSQLRNLSIAQSQNMQWSISQLDTEFANLHATLSDRLHSDAADGEDVQLRIDIAISRLGIARSGRSADIFAGNVEAEAMLASFDTYVEEVVALSDKPGPLSNEDLRAVLRLTKDIRPSVRKISLLGVSSGVERDQARRTEFSRQLARTGGIAIALLVLMVGLLVLLDRLLARAERTDLAKSQFLTVMSHEMRTPLNGILGVLDLLKTTKLSGKQWRYTQIATASSEILLEHINEALDITRIEAGTLRFTPHNFDLSELVTSLVDVLEPLAREKGLTLTLHLDERLGPAFHGDSNRIRQILTNLIGNAIKFTDAGTVALKVERAGSFDVLQFVVSDTGAGIAQQHQEQVFEDFVALEHSAGRQSRGDGLGLSISRRIAQKMGGDIALQSAVGRGSTFTLTVPLKPGGVAQIGAGGTLNTDAVAVSPSDVLIVEDNSVNRNVLADMLVGLGHRVTEAVNGAECLEKAALRPFDVIFMDISMPVMDGVDATKRLRADHGPNQRAVIVGLTAHGREEYRDAATNAGMDRFHTKPIRLDALQAIMVGVSPPQGASLGSQAQSDMLAELCRAMGSDKVADVGRRFFAELEDLCAQIGDGPVNADAAHKMKGAASMLGLAQLEAPLEKLEADARAGHLVVDLDNRLAALRAVAQTTEIEFFKALDGLES